MSNHFPKPDDLTRHPSPIPPYLRPAASRTHSSSSVSSHRSRRSQHRHHDSTAAHVHPHNQNDQYIASAFDPTLSAPIASPTGVEDRLFFDNAAFDAQDRDAAADQSMSTANEGDTTLIGSAPPDGYESGDESDGHDSEADWAAAREGSNNRRPAWRRASPRWVYPFIIGVVLAVGNSAPPRSELYVNLACLAHPPEAPSAIGVGVDFSVQTLSSFGSFRQHYAHVDYIPSIGQGTSSLDNVTLPTAPSSPSTEPLSPADEWFLRLQRNIYEWNKAHGKDRSVPDSPSLPTSTRNHQTVGPVPTGPIPHPAEPSSTTPAPGGDDTTDDPNTNGPPFRAIDPALCKKSPKVQAAAAKLTMVLSVIGGILGALTTGQWGRLSDRLGRTKILAVCEVGLMLYELCFILVASFPYLVPGGYYALVLGPTFEGLVGGTSTLLATVNAYVSDTTPDGSRATVFARVGGMAMAGFAAGPVLGSWVIKMTGNIMIPFYISAGVHAFFIFYVLLVLPESLSTEARVILSANAKAKSAAKKRKEAAEREWEEQDAVETPVSVGPAPDLDPTETTPLNPNAHPTLQHRASRMSFGAISANFNLNGDPSTHSKRRKRMTGMARRWGRTMMAPLQPLEVFMPKERDDGNGRGRDWNLTLIAGALFMMSTMMSFMGVKAQYTFYKYAWTSTQLGPYMSLVSFGRGLTLLIIVPLGMKLAKPYFLPSPTPAETAPLLTGPSSSDPATPDSTEPVPPKVKHRRPAILDLYLIRLSLVFESGMFLVLALGIPAPFFVLVSFILTLASGQSAATNSLALTLIGDSRQSGRLFGGVAVLQTLGTALIGPLEFGSLFSATVGGWAEAIFVLAALHQGVAFTLFMCVRLPEGKQDEEQGRGRGRKVKRGKEQKVGFDRGSAE